MLDWMCSCFEYASQMETALTLFFLKCGYGVPKFSFQDDRNTLCNFFEKKGEKGSEDYMRSNNRVSIDNLSTPQGDKFNKEEGK